MHARRVITTTALGLTLGAAVVGGPATEASAASRVTIHYSLHGGTPVATDGTYSWDCPACGSGFSVGKKYVRVHLRRGIHFGSGRANYAHTKALPWHGGRLPRVRHGQRLLNALFTGITTTAVIPRPSTCQDANPWYPSGKPGNSCWAG